MWNEQLVDRLLAVAGLAVGITAMFVTPGFNKWLLSLMVIIVPMTLLSRRLSGTSERYRIVLQAFRYGAVIWSTVLCLQQFGKQEVLSQTPKYFASAIATLNQQQEIGVVPDGTVYHLAQVEPFTRNRSFVVQVLPRKSLAVAALNVTLSQAVASAASAFEEIIAYFGVLLFVVVFMFRLIFEGIVPIYRVPQTSGS